jgi:hypothetical protein
VKAAAATALSALCQVKENLPALREPGLNLASVCEAIVSNLAKGEGSIGGSGVEEGVYARRAAEILQKLKLKVY